MSSSLITVEVLPPDTAPMHLGQLQDIAAINRYHNSAISAADEARSKAEQASHFALLAGTLLEDLRQSTPHGGWESLFSPSDLTPNRNQIGEWFGFEFSSRTALKYIAVAKRIRLQRAMTLKAQKHLSAIASAPSIDEEAREFLSNLTKGQTLRQLYLDLDIITAKAKAEPEKPAQPRIPKTEAQDRLEDAREMLQVWQDSWEKFVRLGYLDDLIPADLERLKDFQLGMGDRIKARLK